MGTQVTSSAFAVGDYVEFVCDDARIVWCVPEAKFYRITQVFDSDVDGRVRMRTVMEREPVFHPNHNWYARSADLRLVLGPNLLEDNDAASG